MIQSQNLRTPLVLRGILLNLHHNILNFSQPRSLGRPLLAAHENPRFYRTKIAPQPDKSGDSGVPTPSLGRIPTSVRSQAQAALLDYFHITRCFSFGHAEHMSKNSPHFLKKILGKIGTLSGNADIKHSVARRLRYHPVDEFEPFFESSGLKPCEFRPYLPRHLMFLTDAHMLLKNYDVLCNYGVSRHQIGKIYMQATEIFQYDCGVLKSELQALEDELGFCRSSVVIAVQCSPCILIRNVHVLILKVWRELKALGIDYSFFETYLSKANVHNWSQILKLLCLFREIYGTKGELQGLVIQRPQVLFEDSGNATLSLIGVLLKFGCSMDLVRSLFLQFPQVQVGKFLLNMRSCIILFIEIGMEVEEIGRFVQSDALLLGSCPLKKASSLLKILNSGKKKISEIIKDDPEVMKNWVLKSKVKPLEKDLTSKKKRIEFLLNLGFVEDSSEMKRALKLCRGKGQELQERLDCFVKAGLDRKDVLRAIKSALHVLNQSKEVIESKIDFLINTLGFPASSLLAHPACICLTTQSVKHRMSMYAWLRDQGLVEPNLALSTLLLSSEKCFITLFVNCHPRGPDVWEDLKKKIYSK